MADNDPKKPPDGPSDNYAEHLGQRIRQNVHDQIDARMRYRQERWQARMDRRRERWARRGMGGVGIHGASGGLIIGLILAGIGAVLLLQNFGIFANQDLWDFWPVILVVAGIARASTAFSVTGRMWGGLVALAGLLFLAANFGFIHHNLWEFFWPVILIVAGGVMLVRGLERNHYLDQWRSGGAAGMPGASPGTTPGTPGSSPGTVDPRSMNMVHEFAIFGGGHRRIDSQEFEGGDIVALFGGVQLDLRQAETKLSELNIDVTAAFGGVEIRVPETWAVSMRVTSIFGGYDDKTHLPPPGAAKPPTLVITGAVIFGGLGVKN
jgi:predicted membrane protein